METIIETTQSIEGNLKFDSLFFTFHGVEFCDKRWRSTVKKIISPTKWLPRILQEYIVVKILRAYVYRQNVKVIVCTDEKACKLAAKARGGKISQLFYRGSIEVCILLSIKTILI